MAILIQSKRRSPEKLRQEYTGWEIIDVTSQSTGKFLPLSPFYPLGNIPVPFSPGTTAQSVEGIWQGLKVFRSQDIDVSKFSVTSMKGLKRTATRFGQPLGHRKGIQSTELLGYFEARLAIYLPTYEWILKNKVSHLVQELYELSTTWNLILLDYETNEDVNNLAKPLSHAGLIKYHIEHGFSLDGLIHTS